MQPKMSWVWLFIHLEHLSPFVSITILVVCGLFFSFFLFFLLPDCPLSSLLLISELHPAYVFRVVWKIEEQIPPKMAKGLDRQVIYTWSRGKYEIVELKYSETLRCRKYHFCSACSRFPKWPHLASLLGWLFSSHNNKGSPRSYICPPLPTAWVRYF